MLGKQGLRKSKQKTDLAAEIAGRGGVAVHYIHAGMRRTPHFKGSFSERETIPTAAIKSAAEQPHNSFQLRFGRSWNSRRRQNVLFPTALSLLRCQGRARVDSSWLKIIFLFSCNAEAFEKTMKHRMHVVELYAISRVRAVCVRGFRKSSPWLSIQCSEWFHLSIITWRV